MTEILIINIQCILYSIKLCCWHFILHQQLDGGVVYWLTYSV